ncbi:MAG: energy-coupling factor ABC transporter permease [Sedimentisphaerales bacterium]|nr:energy-coupling factor ABC transporter permease [Sedimentisphaerales bacterium]
MIVGSGRYGNVGDSRERFAPHLSEGPPSHHRGQAGVDGHFGASVFVVQTVNFQLPAMPGTSGHIGGAVLLAIILGPIFETG